MLAQTFIIYAGKILELEDRLIYDQTLSESQAEFLAQALAIATDGPVHVRWLTIGRQRDFYAKPDNIAWSVQECFVDAQET